MLFDLRNNKWRFSSKPFSVVSFLCIDFLVLFSPMEDRFPVFVVLVSCSEFSSRDLRASFTPCCFFAGVRMETNRISITQRYCFFFGVMWDDVLCQDSDWQIRTLESMTHLFIYGSRTMRTSESCHLTCTFQVLMMRRFPLLFHESVRFCRSLLCQITGFKNIFVLEILRRRSQDEKEDERVFAFESALFSDSCSIDNQAR